jgi:hypothetical protein
MGLIRKTGTTILQHDNSLVGVGGVSGGRLDDKFSDHAH